MSFCPSCRAEYMPNFKQCYDCKVDLVDALADDVPDRSSPEVALVTITAVETPVQASLLASRLESEGIECFIADAETVSANVFLSNALGGVKVQVRESDAQRAAEILRRQSPDRSARRPACPHCGSRDVHREGMSAIVAILAIVTLGVFALFFPPGWKCDKCSQRWR